MENNNSNDEKNVNEEGVEGVEGVEGRFEIIEVELVSLHNIAEALLVSTRIFQLYGNSLKERDDLDNSLRLVHMAQKMLNLTKKVKIMAFAEDEIGHSLTKIGSIVDTDSTQLSIQELIEATSQLIFECDATFTVKAPSFTTFERVKALLATLKGS